MPPSLIELEQRIALLEKDQDTRLSLMEDRLEAMGQVVQSVANDTLRVCSALQEMVEIGRIPEVPWDLASLLVEFHHAYLEHQNNPEYPMDTLTEIKDKIRLLRQQYRIK